MKKGIYLFSSALLLMSAFPLTAFGEEEITEDSSVMVNENNMEVEIIQHDEVEGIQENQPKQTEELPEMKMESSSEDLIVTDNLDENNQEITEGQKTETIEVQTEKKNPRAISPESGIEIPDYDGKLVDKDNTITDVEKGKVTAEYAFMPQINSDTEVIVSGNYTKENDTFNFMLNDNQQGKISIIYKNVGTYNGKIIDLKVSFDAWTLMKAFEKNGTYSAYLNLSSSSTAIYMKGLRALTANYYFLDNLTGLNATISGFFNFTDIDNNQYLDIYDNANIKNFYAAKDNVLYYKINENFISIGDYFGKNALDSEKDKKYWLTYTYDKTSHFTITFNELREEISGYSALFDYSYAAPVVIETQQKKVAKESLPITQNMTYNPQKSQSFLEPVSVQREEQSLLPATGEKEQSMFLVAGSLLLSFMFFLLKKEHKNGLNGK